MHTNRLALASALATAALAAASPSAAQGPLFPSAPAKGISLEVSRPSFDEAEVTAASSTWFLSGRLPLGARLAAVADLPFAHGRFQGEAGELFDGAATVLGNPKVGVELLASRSLTVEGSVRLPLGTADESSVGDVVAMLSDPQRAEAFAMDVVPVSAAFRYERPLAGALSLRARAGATAVVPTDRDSGPETTTLLDYSLFGTYQAGTARVGVGFSGRWDASEEDGGFADNSLHYLGATVDAQLSGVRPGISLRVPLDAEYGKIVNPSVGLYLQVPLR